MCVTYLPGMPEEQSSPALSVTLAAEVLQLQRAHFTLSYTLIHFLLLAIQLAYLHRLILLVAHVIVL